MSERAPMPMQRAILSRARRVASGFNAYAESAGGEAKHCGTTALLVWLDRLPTAPAPATPTTTSADVANQIHVANLGDTRCVLSRG